MDMTGRYFNITLAVLLSAVTLTGCGLDASITGFSAPSIFEKATNSFEPISGKAPKETTLRGYQIEQSVGYPLSERHVKTARGYSFTFGSETDGE